MASFKFYKKIVVLSLIYIVIRQIKITRSDNEPNVNATSDSRIIYDQRQNGKYNIHVVIKDVAIIEMDQNEISDQNYNDDEYYYDEDDLTVKPLKPTATSAKPLYSTIFTTSHTTTSSAMAENIATTFSSTSQGMTFALTPTSEATNSIMNNEHTTTHSSLNIPGVEIQSRSKVEPIYAFEKKLGIQPEASSRQTTYLSNDPSKTLTNSKMFKLKIHRSHRSQRQSTKRCHSNQYKSSGGKCRENISSSGSLLKRLLNMLITLPFTAEQHHGDN